MRQHQSFRLSILVLSLSLIAQIAQSKDLPSRVILYSFDGAAFDRVMTYLQEPTWPETGLKEMHRTGLQAEMTMASNPTLTASSHTSIHTGSYPDQHGVVSNYFHLPNTMITQGVSGFSAEYSTKALWENAMAAGKRVGIISFPGADNQNNNPRRHGDFGINYNDKEAFSFGFTANSTQFSPLKQWDQNLSFSQPKAVSVSWKEEVEQNGVKVEDNKIIYLVALDRNDDGVVNYDSVVWDQDLDLSNGTLTKPFGVKEWGNVVFTSRGVKKGAWTKLFELAPDLSTVRIYVGTLHHNQGYPDAFVRELDEHLGIWPGEPDPGVGRLIDLETWIEQAMRLSNWLVDLYRYVVANKDFDLLIGYQPIIDEFGHSILLTDQRQPEFSEKKVLEAETLMRRAYLQMNKVVEELMREKGGNTALLVVSDHGMQPIWSMAYPNRFLKKHGLIELEDDSNMGAPLFEGEELDEPQWVTLQQKTIFGSYLRTWPMYLPMQNASEVKQELSAPPGGAQSKTKARAFVSGGLGHVYINLKGRESDGVVDKKDYPAMVQELKGLFEDWKYKGEKVFERVLTRDEATSVHLNHPNSGDLILIASPGVHLQNVLVGNELVEQANFRGQHGYLAQHPSMAPAFFATGVGIDKKQVPLINNIEIAPTVLSLLNIPNTPPSKVILSP